jgi:DMSO/TMAO reductase YedYZ molybdopterin-dependent catalytic subunit
MSTPPEDKVPNDEPTPMMHIDPVVSESVQELKEEDDATPTPLVQIPIVIPPVIAPEPDISPMTRRAMLRGAGMIGAAVLGWRWLATRSEEEGVAWPLRRVLRANQALWDPTSAKLAPEFPAERAEEPRMNGWVGATEAVKGPEWRLVVKQPNQADRNFTLDELKSLPRQTMTTEFKCVEGWSTITTWAGVRMVDFLNHFQLGKRPDGKPYPYASLMTSDDAYYVAMDAPSLLHPQTLLCDSLLGETLALGHGGPIRLITTLKYGIKNIKWLEKITFTDDRPSDYWGDRGYDWFAGL